MRSRGAHMKTGTSFLATVGKLTLSGTVRCLHNFTRADKQGIFSGTAHDRSSMPPQHAFPRTVASPNAGTIFLRSERVGQFR